MPDRKNVIKGLEGISDYFFDIYRNDTDSYKCAKAQEYSDVAIDAISMLKEQEAVEPIRISTNYEQHWRCGKCNAVISLQDKFCHECGSTILWKGR